MATAAQLASAQAVVSIHTHALAAVQRRAELSNSAGAVRERHGAKSCMLTTPTQYKQSTTPCQQPHTRALEQHGQRHASARATESSRRPLKLFKQHEPHSTQGRCCAPSHQRSPRQYSPAPSLCLPAHAGSEHEVPQGHSTTAVSEARTWPCCQKAQAASSNEAWCCSNTLQGWRTDNQCRGQPRQPCKIGSQGAYGGTRAGLLSCMTKRSKQ
jgi:hypothetical protein